MKSSFRIAIISALFSKYGSNSFTMTLIIGLKLIFYQSRLSHAYTVMSKINRLVVFFTSFHQYLIYLKKFFLRVKLDYDIIVKVMTSSVIM